MTRLFASILISLLLGSNVMAQSEATADSLKEQHTALYIGVPAIVGSVVLQGMDKHYKSIRNEQFPGNTAWDNYTQWAPLAATLGLKLAGVESRSKWGRMLTSQAFSGAIMAAMVNGMKYTIKRERPDGSSRNSYPSGHTATAMMCAYFLSKEYGHKSPWITVGAYTCAGATGLLRVVNNRHWLSDVVGGAGIGLVAAELGYFLGDVIFKDKGLNNIAHKRYEFDRYRNPSFVGVSFGGVIPTFSTAGFDKEVSKNRGGLESIEGAYFFDTYLGVGGKFSIYNIKLDHKKPVPDDIDPSLYVLSGTIGPYVSYPLSSRFLIGATAQVGYSHMKEVDEENRYENGISYNTGLAFTFRTAEQLSVNLFADYYIQPRQSSVFNKQISAFGYGLRVNVDL